MYLFKAGNQVLQVGGEAAARTDGADLLAGGAEVGIPHLPPPGKALQAILHPCGRCLRIRIQACEALVCRSIPQDRGAMQSAKLDWGQTGQQGGCVLLQQLSCRAAQTLRGCAVSHETSSTGSAGGTLVEGC